MLFDRIGGYLMLVAGSYFSWPFVVLQDIWISLDFPLIEHLRLAARNMPGLAEAAGMPF